MIMNKLQTMWSISRRKSLINCPRQYILRYSRNQTFYNHEKNNITHSLKDLVIRTSRKVMLERLEDLKNRLEWSDKMVLLKIRLGVKAEIKNRKLVRKSIFASKKITTGEKFSSNNLTTKRPGNGISPMLWKKLIGKRSKRNYKTDDLIKIK